MFLASTPRLLRSTSLMLPQLRVASPFTAAWEMMTGDDRVRYRDLCKLNVYNFFAMSAAVLAISVIG